MGKVTIHCVRHAEGYHNLNIASHALPDPSLTPKGEEQCATLSKTFPHSSNITQIIASPLRRTLYTALLSFPTYTTSGKKVLALSELQETSDLPCDTGSSPSALAEEFPSEKVDLSLVKEGWNSKIGSWSPASSAIEARALSARKYIRSLAIKLSADKPSEDHHIIIVTHGSYLHFFTEDWRGAGSGVGTGWHNTECRSYVFISENDESASLRETGQSKERRRGSETVLSGEEQMRLRDSVQREWAENGLMGENEPLKEEGQLQAVCA